MANGYSIFVGLVVIVALSLAAWFFSPKGENQVYVVVHNPSSIMHKRDANARAADSGDRPSSSRSSAATSCGPSRSWRS